MFSHGFPSSLKSSKDPVWQYRSRDLSVPALYLYNDMQGGEVRGEILNLETGLLHGFFCVSDLQVIVSA